MPFDLDAELGVSAQALQLHARRIELLATNIANADTPNYKARDVDFRSALNRAAELANSPKLATTQPLHLGAPNPSPEADVKYRVPLAPALDGNTVDVQLEEGTFAEATVHYQSSLFFVNDTFRGLMLAITGQ